MNYLFMISNVYLTICLFIEILNGHMSYHIWSNKSTMCTSFSKFRPVIENSVDPDQLASDEASWSGYTLFIYQQDQSILIMNLHHQIDWTLELYAL